MKYTGIEDRACARKDGRILSEKVIRRIMKALGLKARGKRARKHSPFKGDISPAAENLVKRNS